jgi:hypothetical protein
MIKDFVHNNMTIFVNMVYFYILLRYVTIYLFIYFQINLLYDFMLHFVNLLFNLMLQVIYGRTYWIFHIGESILTNVFLNRFQLIQRICLTRGATAKAVLGIAGGLSNMP